MERTLLSVEESAVALGVRPPTIRAWLAGRKLSKVKLGRRVLVPAAEIQAMIERNTIPALPERSAAR
jgi:excisionase family DNA binding protein